MQSSPDALSAQTTFPDRKGAILAGSCRTPIGTSQVPL